MKVVTIRDVAREAGVSIATVSRVLNAPHEVEGSTREKVLRVIQRLNYIRNTNASNLKQRHTEFAAVILRGRRNSFLTDLAERIMAKAHDSGVQFLMEIIDERDDEFLAARKLYLERKLSGIIFLGANLKNRRRDIARLDIPCVFATVEAAFIDLAKVSSVSVDNFASGRAAADRLYQLGHRHIAMVGYFGDRTDSTGRRLHGVLDSLNRHGIPYDPQLFVDTDFSLARAWEATCQLIRRGRPFTALIAISDMLAIAAGKALYDHGLRVPEDVSLVGFDGIEQGRYSTPSLATMRQPSEQIADTTLQLFSDMCRGAPGRHVLLDAAWLDGGSVRAI